MRARCIMSIFLLFLWGKSFDCLGSAPVPVKNAVKAKSAVETARRFVVAGGTSKKAAIRVPNDPLRMSGIKFLRSVKHKLIAGRSKTLKLSERTQVMSSRYSLLQHVLSHLLRARLVCYLPPPSLKYFAEQDGIQPCL